MIISRLASISTAAPPVFTRVPRQGRPPVRGTRTAATTALAIMAILLLGTGWLSPEHLRVGLRYGVVVLVPVIAGILAARAPATHRMGYGLVALGVLLGLTALAQSNSSLVYSIGRIAVWLVPPVLVYLMLIFPHGRLEGRWDRRLFIGALALVLGLFVGSALVVQAFPTGTPFASCEADCPPNFFALTDSEPAVMAAVVAPLRETLTVVLMAGVSVTLLRRLGSATTTHRRTIAPVVVVGLVASLVLATFMVVRRAAPGSAAVDELGSLWLLCLVGFPAAFLVGLVMRRLVIADALGRLSLTLNDRLDARGLQHALASSVGDESVEVRLWDDDRSEWTGPGVRRGPLTAHPGREVVQVGADGLPLAQLSFDAALHADDELLEAAATQTSAVLRQARILRELARSRSRLAAAASSERARIERDLHDGAQQYLVALRIKLAVAEELLETQPAAGHRKLAELDRDVGLALDELRALAHGIYPSLLTHEGLAAALSSAAGRFLLPVHLSVSGVTRHSPEIESAVYFTCLEAMQNAAKHAQGATGIWVVLRQASVLEFSVRDDGCGFRAPSARASGGLRTMADRMEALGGRLRIDTGAGRGTRVAGLVPLGAPMPEDPASRGLAAA